MIRESYCCLCGYQQGTPGICPTCKDTLYPKSTGWKPAVRNQMCKAHP